MGSWGLRGGLGPIVRAVALLASLRYGWAVALGNAYPRIRPPATLNRKYD